MQTTPEIVVGTTEENLEALDKIVDALNFEDPSVQQAFAQAIEDFVDDCLDDLPNERDDEEDDIDQMNIFCDDDGEDVDDEEEDADEEIDLDDDDIFFLLDCDDEEDVESDSTFPLPSEPTDDELEQMKFLRPGGRPPMSKGDFLGALDESARFFEKLLEEDEEEMHQMFAAPRPGSREWASWNYEQNYLAWWERNELDRAHHEAKGYDWSREIFEANKKRRKDAERHATVARRYLSAPGAHLLANFEFDEALEVLSEEMVP